MNLTEIQDLIKFVSKSGVSEVEIEQKDFKIVIKTKNNVKEQTVITTTIPQVTTQTQAVQTPQVIAPVVDAPKTTTPPADDSKYITIKSPMIGTFYRSSSPDKPVFVNVGDTIKAGDKICIIEAMKLFNEIEAEVSGKIVKVLVDDAKPVEYDQPLFLVEPA